MNVLNEINRLVNRHKARLLCDLEAAGCPQIFRNAVVAEIDWLRSDLNKIERIEGLHEYTEDTSGNR
jgi:hypothetical protein